MEGMKMINKTLFAREWKANYKLLLIFSEKHDVYFHHYLDV